MCFNPTDRSKIITKRYFFEVFAKRGFQKNKNQRGVIDFNFFSINMTANVVGFSSKRTDLQKMRNKLYPSKKE
ncbi:hypothetical protein C5167_050863 [Papaver somniferum]|uniref:Uncharacterized protein n=1 Tax=Papaver somniferum TaxID=3469 RepID=A0A4Y7KTE2_PAPSO|nr:hypothetical protein C5167_050863 [Papaver somniferum]